MPVVAVSLPALAHELARKYRAEQDTVACIFGRTGATDGMLVQMIQQHRQAVVFDNLLSSAVGIRWYQHTRHVGSGYIVLVQAASWEDAQDRLLAACGHCKVEVPEQCDFYEMPRGRLLDSNGPKRRWSRVVSERKQHMRAISILASKAVSADDIRVGLSFLGTAPNEASASHYMMMRLREAFPGDEHKVLAVRMRLQAVAFMNDHFGMSTCDGMSEEAVNTVIAEAPLDTEGTAPTFDYERWINTVVDVRARFLAEA